MAAGTKNDIAYERERLDGRIAFVAATFVVAFAFSALLDRVGVPPALVEAVSPYFVIIAFAVLGFSLHSMQTSCYYAAGRATPFEYAGFATAALVAAVILPFAAEFSTRSWLIGPGAGVFVGVAILGRYLGPILRRSGAFSLSGLLSARFPGLALRLGVIAIACVSSALVALAGEESAVGALTGFLGGHRIFVAGTIGLAALLIAAPGGLRGTVWTACAAGAVAVAGFGWPTLKLALRGAPPFGGAGGSIWREFAARLDDWGVTAHPPGYGAEVVVTLAFALGVATLAPLLTPAITTEGPQATRKASYVAFGWALVFAMLITASVCGAALSLARQSAGRPAERLPDAVYMASAHGLVTICGAKAPDPASARRACSREGAASGAPLRAQDMGVRADFLLTSLPALEQMGAAVSGLLASAQIALALALGAAGLQAFGTALGHEAFYRMRGETDLTSRRLATTRLTQTAIAAAGAAAAAYSPLDPRVLLGVALSLSAAGVAPVVALALWPRAADRDALIALVVGLCLPATTALLEKGVLDSADLAFASLAGAAAGLCAGIGSALLRPASSAQAEAFVARLLRGDSEVMGPQKGA